MRRGDVHLLDVVGFARAAQLALGAELHALAGLDLDCRRRLFLFLRHLDVALALELHGELLVGIERRQVVEVDAVPDLVRVVEVDLVDLEQGEIALAILRRADLAFDRIAGAKRETAHLARGDVDVVGPGKIVGLGRAQEAEPVLEDFQHAVAEDRGVVFRELLQDREHHVLAPQRAGVLDLQVFGKRQQLGRRLALKFLEIHGYFDGSCCLKWETRGMGTVSGEWDAARPVPVRPLRESAGLDDRSFGKTPQPRPSNPIP